MIHFILHILIIIVAAVVVFKFWKVARTTFAIMMGISLIMNLVETFFQVSGWTSFIIALLVVAGLGVVISSIYYSNYYENLIDKLPKNEPNTGSRSCSPCKWCGRCGE